MDRTLKNTPHPKTICSSSPTRDSGPPKKPPPLRNTYQQHPPGDWFQKYHERCIYQTKIKHQRVLFLRQVDDFAVASKDPTIAKDIIAKIGNKLQVPLNYLGVIATFNEIDVLQTRGQIKISCQTYLDKKFRQP